MKLQKPLPAKNRSIARLCTHCGYKTYKKNNKAVTTLRFLGFGTSFFAALPLALMHGVTCPKCDHFSFVRPNSYLGRYAIKKDQERKADKTKYKQYIKRQWIGKIIFYGSLLLIGILLIILNIYLDVTK